MISNPIEEAIHSALNDRRIFWMPQELINKSNFSALKDALSKLDKSLVIKIIGQSKGDIEGKIERERDFSRKRYLDDALRLLNSLETRINQDPLFVLNLLNQFESFGPVICNLPNMEDSGKIIEGHSRSTAEQFLLYKIQKEKDGRRRQSLIALYEIIIKLYDKRVEPLEIAFFVRKINSLGIIVEVIK